MNSSSAYIVVKDVGYTYHFTGVTAISHSLSLKIFEKADATELGSFVNGAKNQPDRVTLSVVETDASHSARGWSARMLDVLAAVKRDRRLCRVVTPYRTYEDMLLSSISATQDETIMDGWSGDITFTEYIPLAILGEAKTDDNASTAKNTGSAAPANKVTGMAEAVRNAAGIISTAGAVATAFLSLDSGSTLEQRLARAGIAAECIRYIL